MVTTTESRQTVLEIAQGLAGAHLTPPQLVQAILEALGDDPQSLRDALAECLPPYCRAFVAQSRNAAIAAVTGTRSARVAGIRNNVPALLSQLLSTERGYIPIGLCNHDDLLFAAGSRRTTARKLEEMAQRYERLADELVAAGVATVGDLPEDVIRAALTL